MIPIQWTEPGRIKPGTQLQLSYFARPGELAQVSFHCTATHRPENHVVVRLRPDWADTPAWKNSDKVPWEWHMPEPAFGLSPGDIVLVLGASRLLCEPPHTYEPWVMRLACVQRVNDPGVKLGWVNSTWLDVPFLLNS